MAFAPSLHSSIALRVSSPSPAKLLFVGHSAKANQIPPRPLHSPPTLVFSRRRHTSPATTSSEKHERNLPHTDAVEEDLDEDAFEALFSQLEEDLKNDDLSINDSGDEISEEDLARLERELEEALGDDELLGMSNSTADNIESDINVEKDDDDDNDDDDDDERQVKLKTWQLRRLASALKTGRRKANIKNLAADVCLDRAFVLKLLRDPPTNLLMMSATLPDEPMPAIAVPETKSGEDVPLEIHTDAAEPEDKAKSIPEDKAKVPVHVMQHRWSAQKRWKKVQIETLERVYKRSKRPTNAMISSIVHVTNLPRKRVVKWFEDKRAADGVPDHRLPFQRSASGTVFNH